METARKTWLPNRINGSKHITRFCNDREDEKEILVEWDFAYTPTLIILSNHPQKY